MGKLRSVLKGTFVSLRYPDFRYFWVGQCVSLTGTWMQRTAQMWLVYSLTNSPLLVGAVGVCQFTPMLLFSLFAGVLVDRFPKKRILIATQSLFMLQAAVLATLAWTGQVRYWHILVLSAFFGLVQTVDMPARQSFFIDLVGREHVMNAVSLNSTIVNLSRIVGPALSGLAMEFFGVAVCFTVNAASYLAVIGGLFLIRAGRTASARASSHVLSDILDGLRYIAKNETLMINVVMMGVVCTFAMNNDVILPVFAKTALHMGASGYTSLVSAAGAGSFCAAILMAWLSGRGLHKSFLFYSALAVSALQLLLAFTHSFLLSVPLITLVGFCNLIFLNTGNSIFQLCSSNEYRGRVMSVYSFLNQGSTPVGNFVSGLAMEASGGNSGFLFCGAATGLLTATLLIGRRRCVRDGRWLRLRGK